ncbi:MAG: DMT family transporter [Bdellovibrionales bacterium]|nr:DMT family transporter [Bdellovibrionales bacterium]
MVWKNPDAMAPGLNQGLKKESLRWLVPVGIVTFFLSPFFAYDGLAMSTSSANALVVAVEPIFTALMAWAFLRERLGRSWFVSIFFALAGFLLLSRLDPRDVMGSLALFHLGNLFFLCQMPAEAFYSIASRKLAGKLSPVAIFGLSIPWGVLALSCAVLLAGGLPDPSLMTAKALIGTIWTGVLSTTFGYIYWSKALVQAPVAPVALTLFLQPILGSVLGVTILKEEMTLLQILGAVTIVGAVALQTTAELRKHARGKPASPRVS